VRVTINISLVAEEDLVGSHQESAFDYGSYNMIAVLIVFIFLSYMSCDKITLNPLLYILLVV